MSLAIVVPYRDREAHLAALLPALSHHLSLRHAGRSFGIYVVEQQAGKPFNRGKMCNVGFVLARRDGHDQVCFHDVDYIPVDADYSPVSGPTRLIWHGLRLKETYHRFFGAVVAFPSVDFARVNGFSNLYWGWGPEDLDLRLRCRCAGLAVEHRDGTFRALPHPQDGWSSTQGPTERTRRNAALLRDRLPDIRSGAAQGADGLSSLEFQEARRYRRTVDAVPEAPIVWHVVVDV